MDTSKYPEHLVFGLDIGTRSIVGTVGYKQNENDFIVVSQSVRYHETRAMLDGQIHDINKVAETIQEVKLDLEKQLNRTLTQVCIAAAGRVLKTVTVRADYELPGEVTITEEQIRSLELLAVEKAYDAIKEEAKKEGISFYCVGYSVVHYYLNDYVITNLEEHKGNRIGAEVLATFLPDEVIEGLYAAVGKAGLDVINLTLEPIAAINVAIPEKFRMLNIALVDVGAGTSDICITKDGSIIAYGMIPMAGDAITNELMQKFLVDFKTAEMIKTSAVKKKSIAFKDIMGLSHKVTREEVWEVMDSVLETVTKLIGEKIIELNGGKSVSAVFIVGGGGKPPAFIEKLARILDLPKERVALRGEEVLSMVTFLQSEIKKDPLLVTPIGICLNYYENRNNFIYVSVNGQRVKLYDNSRLTIVDAALAVGYPNERLFPRRGAAIEFTLNGTKRMVRGEVGEGAVVVLNGKVVGMSQPIGQNDIVQITESTVGQDARMTVGKLPEYNGSISFIVNGKDVICPKYVMANQKLVSDTYAIQSEDVLEIINYYTLEQLLTFMDLPYHDGIEVNHMAADKECKVYENFTVDYPLHQPEEVYEEELVAIALETMQEVTITKDETMQVSVNGVPTFIPKKLKNILVDILDVYPFDLTVAKGSTVVIKRNGEAADFTTPITEFDQIELYWE
jgi:cell division protein FtsA